MMSDVTSKLPDSAVPDRASFTQIPDQFVPGQSICDQLPFGAEGRAPGRAQAAKNLVVIGGAFGFTALLGLGSWALAGGDSYEPAMSSGATTPTLAVPSSAPGHRAAVVTARVVRSAGRTFEALDTGPNVSLPNDGGAGSNSAAPVIPNLDAVLAGRTVDAVRDDPALDPWQIGAGRSADPITSARVDLRPGTGPDPSVVCAYDGDISSVRADVFFGACAHAVSGDVRASVSVQHMVAVAKRQRSGSTVEAAGLRFDLILGDGVGSEPVESRLIVRPVQSSR